jgi:signal peptidase II
MLVAVAGAIVAFDWWSKAWAVDMLDGQPPVPILGNVVRFTFARNSGVAFGLGAGLPFPYYVFSIAAVLVILYLFVKQRVPTFARKLSLALILGGAIGNLIDRVHTGEVVDFIDIGIGGWRWPVFNVADSAVSVGVILFALTWSNRQPLVQASAGAPDGSPPDGSGTQGHDSGAGPLRTVAPHGGAAGPLPGRGADGPLA